jgi:predicted dehydrogenase
LVSLVRSEDIAEGGQLRIVRGRMVTKLPGSPQRSSPALGLAVIGYGYWGPNLVRNFANTEGVRVVSVSDLDPEKLALVRRRHAAVEATTKFRELLADDRIDALAIATPVNTHYELALAALEAGKHVLVEKPLARTAEQARRLIQAAACRNLVLMVDHTFLYTPAVQKIRELVQSGVLGEIFYYNGIRASLGLFQSDVNVIWDLAVHDISIIQYIFDEAPVAVSATAASHVPGSPENMAHITLFFPGSCIAQISVNWLSPIKLRQTLIGGSRRMILYDDVEPTEKIKVYDKGITVGGFAEAAQQLRIGYRAGDMWAPHLPAKEALQTEAEHFVDCLRGDATPISSGPTGLRVVEILEAASRSIAARGAPIRLEAAPRQTPRRSADASTCDGRPGTGGGPYLPDAD